MLFWVVQFGQQYNQKRKKPLLIGRKRHLCLIGLDISSDLSAPGIHHTHVLKIETPHGTGQDLAPFPKLWEGCQGFKGPLPPPFLIS